MTILRTCTALACIAAATSARQVPLKDDVYSAVGIQSPSHKPTINSTKLQGDIKIDKLLARAKELSSIAELGVPEYNHPTRVIGSRGQSTISTLFLSIDVDTF
jgi:aminopeptidase Y